MKLKTFMFAMLTVAAAIAAETVSGPGVIFNAVLTSGKSRLFALSTPGGGSTAWLELGADYKGYVIKEFDESDQSLVLEKDGKREKVRLASASIKEVETKATLADAQAVIEKMHFEDLMGKMVEQQKKGAMDMIRRMGGGGARTAEHEAFQNKIVDIMMTALDPAEMKKDMTRIYAEVFSKEELRALGEFYGTPAGQSFIAKQPEAQAKVQEAIAPRLAAVMPEIAKLGQEFRAQQQAAKAAAAPSTPATPTPAPAPAPK